MALYIAALCRRIAKPLKLRCSGGGLLQGVGCLQSACLARNPQVLRQAPQEFPVRRTAHLPQLLPSSGGFSCSLARNAVVPSSAPFCGRNILPLENPERTGETPHLPARNSFAFFRRKRRIRARHVVQGRVHFYLRRLRFRPHALLVIFFGKFHTRWRRSALFARGLMRLFPAISARKGADERKVGFSQNIETPQK